ETLGTFHLTPDFRGCNPGGPGNLRPYLDPDHSWDGGRRQITGGFLTDDNDEFAIGYYEESDVELYAKLARQFTLCDNYFCSVLGPTFPNREYMHSAWSGGQTTNNLPSDVPGQETGFQWQTIWDLLDAAGVPWAYYFVDLPAIGLWGSRLLRGARHIESFFADAYAGTLPNVVFVDPGFTTGFRTDEHPYGDIRSGQAFSHNVVKAVVESPLWSRSALFVNYDEWGGFFDSVQTPPTVNDETKPLDGNLQARSGSFSQLGFRVPCMIVSPFAPKGVRSSQVVPNRFYDHISILKYVKERFGLPSLTPLHKAQFPGQFDPGTGDRHDEAANIGELLLSQADPARLDPAFLVEALPRPLVHSCPCPHEVLEGISGGLSDLERSATEPLDNGFEELATFLEGIGAPVTPPRSTHDLICKVL
ncbi:MAG: phospholipase C, partial [Candidatus Binatia bacterium]